MFLRGLRMNRSTWIGIGVAAVLIVGTVLRLYDLDKCTFRPDSMEHAKIAKAGHTPRFIYENCDKIFGYASILPLPYAVVNGYIQTLSLPVNPFTVCLPFALLGILAIPVAYGIGVLLFGKARGLLYAGLVACSPFLLQVARDPYIYSYLITGSFLQFYALLLLLRCVRGDGKLGVLFHLSNAAGFFLLVHTHPAGWLMASLYAASIVSILGYHAIRRRRWVSLCIVLVCYAAVGLPLALSSWGLSRVISMKKMSQNPPLVPDLWEMIVRYGWGSTLLRGIISIGALVLGAVGCGLRIKRESGVRALLLLVVVGGFLVNAARVGAGQPSDSRYFAVLLPAYLGLLTMGFVVAEDLIQRVIPEGRGRLVARCGVFILPFLLYATPSYACMKLSGKPVPYRAIIAWMDANLPEGTLVLVDRWLDPWNEMTIHNSTNVVFTFTVPDYPPDSFLKNRWRDTAVDFFRKYPNAAYLQVFKTCCNDPRIGEWSWPADHFSRHVSITNHEALVLRDLGLAFRSDYYHADTNRIVADIFYSTTDDIVSNATAESRDAVCLFGDGWVYTKPWRQTGDFRDWQMLRDTAYIEVYNLSGQTRRADIELRGVGIGDQPVPVLIGGQRLTFPPSTVSTLTAHGLELAPGKNRVKVRLSRPSGGKTVLLVDTVQCSLQ